MNRATKYAENRIKGFSKYKSAIEAGYAPATAKNAYLIERTRAYQDFWLEIDRKMDSQGINPAYIVKKIKDALEATQSTFYRGREVVGQLPDCKTQLKAIELCLKIKFKAEEIQFNKRKIVETNTVEDIDEMTDEELSQLLTSFCE